jgi:hypothetical protein
MKSSLLICMNEVNQVLSYKIVPNDTRGYVEKMIEAIITLPNRKASTLAIFTNNAFADFGILKGLFQRLNMDVAVLQVSHLLYHINCRIYFMQSNVY